MLPAHTPLPNMRRISTGVRFSMPGLLTSFSNAKLWFEREPAVAPPECELLLDRCQSTGDALG